MIKMALSGYYGFNNTGDEAILESIKHAVNDRYPDAIISVLDAKNRFNFKIIRDCDILISGGGTLFQDKTSVGSFLYYLLIIKLAKLMGKKVFVFAQGIGPIIKWYDLQLLKRILDQVDLITVRDLDSFNYYKSLKLKNPRIVETADPTFILSPDDGKKLLELEGVDLNKKPLVGIAVRKGMDVLKLARVIDSLIIRTKCQVIFIPFQSPQDVEASKNVIDQMHERSKLLFRVCSPREILGVISQLDLLIGMRLHSLIFAASSLVPAIGISYDPKVESFMDEVCLPHIPADDIDVDGLLRTAEELLANSSGVKRSLELEKRKLRAKAETNFGMIAMLLPGKAR